jgi:hypothetical protein
MSSSGAGGDPHRSLGDSAREYKLPVGENGREEITMPGRGHSSPIDSGGRGRERRLRSLQRFIRRARGFVERRRRAPSLPWVGVCAANPCRRAACAYDLVARGVVGMSGLGSSMRRGVRAGISVAGGARSGVGGFGYGVHGVGRLALLGGRVGAAAVIVDLGTLPVRPSRCQRGIVAPDRRARDFPTWTATSRRGPSSSCGRGRIGRRSSPGGLTAKSVGDDGGHLETAESGDSVTLHRGRRCRSPTV